MGRKGNYFGWRTKRVKSKDLNWMTDLWGIERRKRVRAQAKRIKTRLKKEFSGEWSINPVSTIKSFIEARKLRKMSELGGKYLANYAKLSTDTKTLARLARKSPRLAKALAKNQNINESQLMAIAKSKNADVKKAILTNKNLPSKVVWAARSKETMSDVLSHPACPTDKLKIGIFTSKERELAILNNPNCPAEILQKADINDIHHVLAIAKNKNATKGQLKEIVEKHYNNPAILFELGKNKNIDQETMDKMVTDLKKPFLMKALEWADNSIIKKFRRSRDNDLRIAMAKNPNISEDYQSSLARLNKEDIDIALSENPNLSEKVQRTLIGTQDQNEGVMANVLNNTKSDSIKGLIVANHEGLVIDYATETGVLMEGKPEISKTNQMPSFSYTSSDFTGGMCAACGRPITGKNGNYGDKCRRGRGGRR